MLSSCPATKYNLIFGLRDYEIHMAPWISSNQEKSFAHTLDLWNVHADSGVGVCCADSSLSGGR